MSVTKPLMRLKLKVQGNDREELESEATKMALDFFGHDRFALVMWEVTPTDLGPSGEKFAELLGMPSKKFRASVTVAERRHRPGMFVGDEEDEDED